MLLMAEAGLFGDLPDYAIFADTGWEPKAVYAHLDRLEARCRTPIYRVKAKGPNTSIRQDHLDPANGHYARMPMFTKGSGRRAQGRIRRQCTEEYKLQPIKQLTRQMLEEHGYGTGSKGKRLPPGSAEAWIGISTDEAHRMSSSSVSYITNRYPLIELRLNKADCLKWLRENGYPEPPMKSACIGCPFHGDAYWRDLKLNHPEEWADAVAFDEAIRKLGNFGQGFRAEGAVFLHRSLLPLAQVDLSTPADHGQDDLFGEDCSGTCGV